MIISQSDHDQSFDLNLLSSTVIEEKSLGSNTELSLIISEGDNSLSIGLEYDTDLFKKKT